MASRRSISHWLISWTLTPKAVSPARRHAPRKRRTLRIEPLETKQLMNADWGGESCGCSRCGGTLCACGFPQIDASVLLAEELNQPVGAEEPQASNPLSSIPLLHSRPSATAKFYLDFNGHFESIWGSYSNVTTPVYDRDGDATTFSNSELTTIQEIWARVSEDFAPFNIDVTTEDPGNFSNGVGLRASIGGNGSWYGSAGGVAYINAFTNNIVNTVYVFSANLGNGNGKYVAEATSHEYGHALGLLHQSLYDAQGNLQATYNPGDTFRAPIMGVGYSSERSTWANGTTNTSTTYQDNLLVLSNGTNGYGYVADDHGNSAGSATALGVSGNSRSGSGLIGQMSDVDYFSFSSGAGAISLTVNVASVGANLDARIELRDAFGSLIASAAPSNSLGATINTSVAQGDYRLVVASQGVYGDLGRYTITGTVQPTVDLTPPTATNDSAATTNVKPVLIDVVANDVDSSGLLNRTTVTITSGVSHGTLYVDPTNGTIRYTPNSAYVGSDSFQYTVEDGGGNVSNVATVTISITQPILGPNGTWVQNLYADVLGRSCTTGEAGFWANLLDTGVSREAVAQGFYASRERRAKFINEYYLDYLGRAADSGGTDYWLNVWQATGGPEIVRSSLIGSGEYLQSHGGTIGGAVQGLYQDVLGRNAANSEVTYWVGVSAHASLTGIAYGFFTSDEHRLGLINGWYQQYLHRSCDGGGASYWLNRMKQGLRQESLQGALVASGEYYQHWA
jgi:hypothetical protein